MTKQKRKLKKKLQIVEIFRTFLIILAVVLLFDLLWGISFSSEKKQIDSLRLEVPRFLWIEKQESGHVKLSTFRSVSALRKDMNKIIKDYKVVKCTKEDIYYNEEENYTMEAYQIKRGLLWNSLIVDYQKGEPICSEDKQQSNTCTFIRTYKVNQISDHPESNKIYVTLSQNQEETATILLPSVWKNGLEVNKTYEFTFQQVGDKKGKDSSIKEIFESYVLTDVEEINKSVLEQKQEKPCD